jgi:hypothetical protein
MHDVSYVSQMYDPVRDFTAVLQRFLARRDFWCWNTKEINIWTQK